MRFCCGNTNTIAEQLDGSTYLFMCDSFCAAPLLWLLGFGVSCLQVTLLFLVWCRAEANLFYEAYSHGLVNVSDSAHDTSWEAGYLFPDKEMWTTLGRTDADSDALEFAPVASDSVGVDRYNAMVFWSKHHPYLPSIFTHPDTQLDYALIFSLTMLVLWASKDALDSFMCLMSCRLIPSLMLALNVMLALATGYDQAYVKFLPIFVWDVPANVIGVSPISMILDSVAVMLILDLDEKAFGFVKGFAHGAVGRVQQRLVQEDERDVGRMKDVHSIV